MQNAHRENSDIPSITLCTYHSQRTDQIEVVKPIVHTTQSHTYQQVIILMDQVVVFQKMFEQVRKEQNFSWFYSELKHHRIAHYIYYLATDNIRIITHDDTVLLLRGTRNLLKVSTTKNPAKIKEAALLHICGKSTFREYCSTLAGAGVFRWVTDVNHNKRSYYAIDNTLLYIEDVENNKPLI